MESFSNVNVFQFILTEKSRNPKHSQGGWMNKGLANCTKSLTCCWNSTWGPMPIMKPAGTNKEEDDNDDDICVKTQRERKRERKRERERDEQSQAHIFQ